MGLRETLTLKETLEAATPGPWEVDGRFIGPRDGDADGRYAIYLAFADDGTDPDLRLAALAPELATLALDWGNWTRDFLLGDNIDPGDRADLTALLARLDQLGKEPGDE